MQAKRIHQFKAGDIVHFHGARFLIQENAHEAQGTARKLDTLKPQPAIEVARAEGEWISGEIVPGYFGPNTPWTFQGNFNCGLYRVEN
jgi:hypothetical protein